jgi:hypothetical protein
MDDFQEPRVAVLVLHVPARAALRCLIADVGRLGRLLGAFPGGPRFALHAIDLLELDLPRKVEVAHGRLPPLGLNLSQIGRDRGLGIADVCGDLHLRPALEVQVGHFLAALGDGEFLTAPDRH